MGDQMTRDPICGRAVEVQGTSTPSAEYKKRHYYFCSKHCLSAFHHRTERLRLQELWSAGSMFNNTGTVRWALA
jgi:YHS domain-containing protein